MPNGKPGLVAGLGRLEECVERPVSALGGAAGRIHGLHVDAGVLLHEVDARARPLDLAADGRRHREPMPFARARDSSTVSLTGAVLLDQRLHDVVDRLELLGVLVRPPGRQVKMSWPDFACASAASGQQQLVALRGDVVDLDLDLLLGRPLLDQGFRCGVGGRHPMVPQADVSLPAACAVRTNGAAIAVADAAAVAATNCAAGKRISASSSHCVFLPLVPAAGLCRPPGIVRVRAEAPQCNGICGTPWVTPPAAATAPARHCGGSGVRPASGRSRRTPA